MQTGNIKYFRGIYALNKGTANNPIKEFELINNDILKSCGLFTKIVRTEIDNGFHDRSRFFEHWLMLRDKTNWKKCKKSGLAKTQFSFVFEGNLARPVILEQKNNKGKDFETPQHFIIAQSINSWNTLVLDIFPNFYPVQKNVQTAILKEHNYLLRIKKGA